MQDNYNYDYDDVEIILKVIEARGRCIAGYKRGDTWKCSVKKTPGNFCPWAYAAIFPYISAVALADQLPWEKKKGYATACCSDPVNLVTFEIIRGKNIPIKKE